MNRHTDGRSEAGALIPLSPLQRKRLIFLAREAYLARNDPVADCPFDTPASADAQTFDDWRHAQCLMAVERPGISACRNEDYLPLTAHFLRLLGRHEEAENMDTRAAMEPRQRVLHEFRRACTAAAKCLDNPIAYAEGFLRRACGVTIDDASEKQLWRAVYLLRRKCGLEKKRGTRNAEYGTKGVQAA